MAGRPSDRPPGIPHRPRPRGSLTPGRSTRARPERAALRRRSVPRAASCAPRSPRRCPGHASEPVRNRGARTARLARAGGIPGSSSARSAPRPCNRSAARRPCASKGIPSDAPIRRSRPHGEHHADLLSGTILRPLQVQGNRFRNDREAADPRRERVELLQLLVR